MEKDYRKYYFLDDYLGEIRDNFLNNGFLNPEEFFCIIIWKANRAKTRIKKRLLQRGNLHKVVEKLTTAIHEANKPEAKLQIMRSWGFELPMATAILTVLYPKTFSVYDIRVRNQLNISKIYSNKKYFSEFLPKIENFAKNKNLSLRDADKYLWGKSFYEDLEKLVGGFKK